MVSLWRMTPSAAVKSTWVPAIAPHMPNEIDPGYPVERARIAGGQFIPGCFAEVVISWGDGEGR